MYVSVLFDYVDVTLLQILMKGVAYKNIQYNIQMTFKKNVFGIDIFIW